MSTHELSLRAARWLESGLLDIEFYSALRGRGFSGEAEAAEDFVEEGMPGLLSPHPFVDIASLPAETRRSWRRGRIKQVLAELAGGDGVMAPVSPLAESADPTAARAHLLALAARLGRESGADTDASAPPVDMSATAGGQAGRVDLTSVVVVATQVRETRQAVQALLRHSEGHRLQVLVVDPASPAHVALGLGAAFYGLEEVELLRVSGSPTGPEAMSHGLDHVAGEVVVLLQPHLRPRRHWLRGVLEATADGEVAGAQPVVLRMDDTIDSAGLAPLTPGGGPVPLLAGHPKEDARRLQGERLEGISPDAMALRADDVRAVGGLDARLGWPEAALDLGARLLERRPAGFRVAPMSLVTSTMSEQQPDASAPRRYPWVVTGPEIYERIGFTSEWRGPDATGGPALVAAARLAGAPDQLRWSLKLPSAPGAGGDRWGDTHFADALAEALRGLGQDVVTCRRGAHDSGPTHLDDVSLALRGLYPVPPVPGQVNVLWVISHPDDVDPGELEGYDLVFAASDPWSTVMSERSGREVVPLLQATGFAPPAAGARASYDEPGVVFVGAANAQRERPLVRMAVEAGVPLEVYGPGWESLPDGVWRGAYVDNRSLPELYQRHGVVLADHWPDMARNGFIANRVFDALASGARVICDDVAGVHDVFDPRDVLVARTPAEVAAAFEALSRPAPDGEVARPALSFRDRARSLLEAALPLGQSLATRRFG